jgi:hypothetical protein
MIIRAIRGPVTNRFGRLTMTQIAQTQFTEELLQLLKETFEGPAPTGPSAFLNKGTGLFQTLEDVSAEAASTQARIEGSTVAAHTEHIRFYVNVHYKLMLGSREEIDWNESWRIKTVNSLEWNDLRRELHQAYATVTQHLRALDGWGDDETGLTMAIVAHTAYHLGAIRQLILAVRPTQQ